MNFFKLCFLVVTFILILFFSSSVLNQVINLNSFKPKITTKIESLTHQKIIISGDISWHTFLWVGITVNDIALMNRDSFNTKKFGAHKADIHFNFWSLFRRKLEISKIKIYSPKINLLNDYKEILKPSFKKNINQASSFRSYKNSLIIQKTNIKPGASTLPLGFVISSLTSTPVLEVINGEINWNSHTKHKQITLRDFKLTTGPLKIGSKTKFKLKTKIKGSDFPKNSELKISSFFTIEKNTKKLYLSETKTTYKADNVRHDVSIGSIIFLNSEKSLEIEKIKSKLSTKKFIARTQANKIKLALNTGSLHINQISNKLMMVQTRATLNIQSLSYHHPSKKAQIEEAVYFARYKSRPIEGRVRGIKLDLMNKSLFISSQTTNTHYRLPLKITNAGAYLDVKNNIVKIPKLNIKVGAANFSANLNTKKLFSNPPLITGQFSSNTFNPLILLNNIRNNNVFSDKIDTIKSTFSIKSSFLINQSQAEFNALAIALDNTLLTGNLSIKDFSNPSFLFKFNANKLNVDKLISLGKQILPDVFSSDKKIRNYNINGEVTAHELHIEGKDYKDKIIKINMVSDNFLTIDPIFSSQ